MAEKTEMDKIREQSGMPPRGTEDAPPPAAPSPSDSGKQKAVKPAVDPKPAA
jgi:hypothetical protein